MDQIQRLIYNLEIINYTNLADCAFVRVTNADCGGDYFLFH